MPARYDPELGTVFDTDEEGNPITQPIGEVTKAEPITYESPRNPLLGMAEQQAEELEIASQDAALGGAVDNRPFVSGALVGDLVKAPINALAGVPTDLVDLGLGLADVVRATAGSVGLPEQYGGMQWNEVFDDRDNPLTAIRRDSIGQMDTKAGALVNQGLRLVGSVVGFKWLYKAPAVFNRVQKIGKLIQGIPGLSQAYRSAGVTQKLATGLNAANRASRGRAVFSQAVKNPYLTTTFKTIADLPETAGWWKGTVNATRSLVGTKITPRNLAETLAWDLFTAFNTFGEGEDDLDETIFDFADSIGIPVHDALLQSPLDTSVARKAKGMLDGTLFAGVGGFLIDVFRIQRFRQAFDAASSAEKKEIVRAFKDSAEDLGNGIGPELMRVQAALSREIGMQGPMPMQGPQQLIYGQDPSVAQIGLDPFGAFPSPINRLTADAPPPAAQSLLDGRVVDPWADAAGQLARLDDVRARQESAALAQSQEFINRNAAIQEVDVQVDPGQPALQGGPDRPLLNPDVLEVRVRVEEPTVSPGGIRRAVEESLARGAEPKDIIRDVRRMLPQSRLGLIDYIQMNPPRKNEVGMLSVADQIWSDYIIGTGLEQGWARIGPDFKPVFVRSLAKEQDVSGLLKEQAKALDQLQQIRDLQFFGETRPKAGGAQELDAALREKQPSNYPATETTVPRSDQRTTPIDTEQAQQLAKAELPDFVPGDQRTTPVDQAQVQKLAEAELQADPALADAQVRSVDAALNANAISDEEFARRAAEVTAEDPDQLIRQFEGVDPNDLGVEIQKLETGRGWMVYGPDGEPIKSGRFTTKRAAERAAEAERKRLRQVLAERAQQKSIDDTGEVLTLGDNDYARDGTLTGKVALTQPQINELIRYPNFRPIFDQFGVKRKTYEFTQGDMADLVDGARALLQTGEVKGPRARVLKALIDKFDTAIDKLEPAVRAQRQADSIAAETKRVLQHGDYC